MPGLDAATAPLTLPVWAVGAAVVLFILVAVLALSRSGANLAGAILGVCFAIALCMAVFVLLQQNATRDRIAERNALNQRAAELAARVVASGSPLACLDAIAGDAVETACEKAVFASPGTVAAAVSYVTARLALLSDTIDYMRRNGGGSDAALATLRLSIESDRYGVVAHVLSVRDSCTPLLCDSYVLFRDPDRVQANLRDRLFDRYVERYAAEWARAPSAPTPSSATPVAEAPPAANYTTASAPPAAAPAAPLPPKYDFPSAASIPAVSIMSPEPLAGPQPKPPPAAAPAETKPAPKRPPQPAPRAAARTQPPPAAPQPTAPAPATQPTPTTAAGSALH